MGNLYRLNSPIRHELGFRRQETAPVPGLDVQIIFILSWPGRGIAVEMPAGHCSGKPGAGP
ncbi:MAG: hypothetical protein O3C46_00245 [Bacteroidetes bacterium]|nr:hypothetical protein [Bacteroidota bacterium]